MYIAFAKKVTNLKITGMELITTIENTIECNKLLKRTSTTHAKCKTFRIRLTGKRGVIPN